MKSKAKILIPVIIITIASLAFVAHAQTRYNLLAPLPTTGDNPTFAEYMPGLLKFLVLFSVVAAVVMIAIGGLMYAVSEAIESQKTARTIITDALYGLIIALLSYLILRTINPDLVDLKLTIPNLPASGTSGNTSSPTGPLVGGPAGSTACIPGGGQCVNCVLFPGTSQGICQPPGCNNPMGCSSASPPSSGSPSTPPPNASSCADWTTKSACTAAGCGWDDNNRNCGLPTTSNPPTGGGCTNSNCGGVVCTSGTSCFCAVGQTSGGTCN